MLSAFNNTRIINERRNKIYILCFTGYFLSIKFVGTVFIFSITSPHVITESSRILDKYLPFS